MIDSQLKALDSLFEYSVNNPTSDWVPPCTEAEWEGVIQAFGASQWFIDHADDYDGEAEVGLSDVAVEGTIGDLTRIRAQVKAILEAKIFPTGS